MKKTKQVELSDSIWILGGLSQILHEHRKLSEHNHFSFHLIMVNLFLKHNHKAKHCQIFTKNTIEKKT